MTSGFTVVGECVADIVREPGRPDQIHPGGSPANVALGLARLGHPVTLVTELGDDRHGRLITRHLRDGGVLLDASSGGGRTPTAMVKLDEAGRADYLFDIAWTLSEVPAPPAVAPRHLHTGSIAAFVEPGAGAVWRALSAGRAASTVSFDPNIRASLLTSHADAVARTEQGVALSDVVKASDEDLEWLYPGCSPAATAARWLSLGASLVLVTLGGRGALVFSGTRQQAIPSRPVRVADTVGAGDAFMSGALHALVEEGALGAAARGRLSALDDAALRRVLECATICAALTVSVPGAWPPDAAGLDAARG